MIRTLAMTFGLVAMALPAMAQDHSALADAAMAGLASENADQRLAGAYAACLGGDGDTEDTVSFFTEAGWTRSDEPDMGIIQVLADDGTDLYAWVSMDGSFCAVWSESIGTQIAAALLDGVLSVGDVTAEPGMIEGACSAYSTGDTVIEVTSSGNDPVCYSDDSSGVRFDRGAAG